MSGSRGRFILLEGVDRAGKTTQARRLVEHLRASGRRTEFIRFPNRSTPIGQMLSQYLSGVDGDDYNPESMHLLFSANRWEMKSTIERLLSEGVTLVCDRYTYSGFVYSAAKVSLRKELGYDEVGRSDTVQRAVSEVCEDDSVDCVGCASLLWLRDCDVGLPPPDLVLLLDADPEILQRERAGFGQERLETLALQRHVREWFLRLRHGSTGAMSPWVTVDALRSEEEVATEVNAIVSELMSR